MNDIAGIPYVEAVFAEDGTLTAPLTLPAGVTDLIVASHGWNNSADDARALYQELFANFARLGGAADPPGRSVAVLGVIWPAKAFDEMVAVSGVPGDASGAAALAAADTRSQQALEIKLTKMAATFTSAAARRTLDELRALLPDLEERGSARRAFVDLQPLHEFARVVLEEGGGCVLAAGLGGIEQ